MVIKEEGPDREMDERIKEINEMNKRRKKKIEENENKTGHGIDGDEYIHFGSGQNLPWLPYAFTLTCAFCGKTGIIPDPRRAMPLSFLGTFLKYACAATPWVYNTLYQMAHYPELEIEEVQKWQKIHKIKIPSHARGRVYSCFQCIPFIRDRAHCKAMMMMVCPSSSSSSSTTMTSLSLLPSPSSSSTGTNENKISPRDTPPITITHTTTKNDWEIVQPLEEALEESWNNDCDEWFLSSSDKRVESPSMTIYSGENGRKNRKSYKVMLPMDLMFHMVHYPNSHRIPEYRMITRLLRNLAGIHDDGSLISNNASIRCLYIAYPSIPMHNLIMQIRSGCLILKGTTNIDEGGIFCFLNDCTHLLTFTFHKTKKNRNHC